MLTTVDTTPTRVGTLAGAIMVIALAGCGLSLMAALVSVRLHEAGFSAHAIGLNTAAGGVATLLSAPFVTFCARRVGVPTLLLGSLLVTAGSMVAFTLTADYTVWLVLRFVVGVCATVMFVLSEFWINSAAPDRWRGLAIGIYVVGLAVGFAIGPLLLTATHTGGDLPFYVGGLIFVGSVVPLALNVKGAPGIEAKGRPGFFRYLREIPVAALASLLHGVVEFACLTFLPVYALRAGVGLDRAALYATLFVVGNGLLQLPIAALADRVDRTRLLLALAGAGCLGSIWLAVQQGPPGLAFDAALVLWGGVVGAFYPVGLGELGRRYKGEQLADANSFFIMINAVGMLFGPPIVGEGFDLVSPAGLFWTLALAIGAYFLFVGAWLARRGPARLRPV